MRILIFVIIIFLVDIFPQEKYLIYFKDKGISFNGKLSKTSELYKQAINSLSVRSIERRQKTIDNDEIIKIEDVPVSEIYISQLKKNGIEIINKLKWFNAVSAFLNENEKDIVLQFPFVEKIEKVHSFKRNIDELQRSVNNKAADNVTSNYGFSLMQMSLSNIPEVHNAGITGKNVLIGVLDTGFDWKFHEAFKNINVLSEYDFIFKDNNTANESVDVPSQHSHGTYVLSVIGGYRDSTLIGAAYDATFVLAKTEDLSYEKNIEEDNYVAALEWMDSIGVDITTSSLGYNIFDDGIGSYSYKDMNGKTAISTKALEIAFSKGISTFCAAGNEGNSSWKYILAPSDGFNVITVGAVNNQNQLALFSSVGPTYDGRIKPELVTMGVNVYGVLASTQTNYQYKSGTSAATPIAAGIGGLLLSAYPHLTNWQIRNILLESCDNFFSPNNQRGYGLLSALKAIEFPNVEIKNGHYFVNKIFLYDKVNPATVKLFFSLDKQTFHSINMNYDGKLKYNTQLPTLINLDNISIYFQYEDSSGTIKQQPSNGKYFNLTYGKLNITLQDYTLPTEYVLKQNYPNPFNNQTTIDFYSISNNPAELIIYNSIGEKVKTFYKDNVIKGLNHFHWDGVSDNGKSVSSGVYFYELKIDNKILTNKMVLLK